MLAGEKLDKCPRASKGILIAKSELTRSKSWELRLMEKGQVRYNEYSSYLQKKYGEKVYKLPVNLPGTCPNRDGTAGTGGCVFCDEEGAGFECLPSTMGVTQQIKENKAFFVRRFKAKKFFAYFQAFTNTYGDFDSFRHNITAAVEDKDIIGVSVSTRPDCVHDSHLDFLEGLKREKGIDINIELGLQTVNYHTLMRINRGHTLGEFIDTVLRIRERVLETTVHLILNLPGDDETDVIECAKVCSALRVDFVKLHSLYVVKGTALGDMYEKGELEIISLEDYINRVVLFLEHLDPRIVVQRLVGKGPQGNLHFCNWGTSWWKIKRRIEEVLVERDSGQGKRLNYTNGAAVRRFME